MDQEEAERQKETQRPPVQQLLDTRDIHDTQVHSLIELTDGILLCSFSEDNNYIEAWNYSPSQDCFQHLWKMGRNHHSTPPNCLIDLGDDLIVSNTTSMFIWDLKHKQRPLYSLAADTPWHTPRTIRLHRHPEALSEGGKKTLLLTGSNDKLILWNIDKSKRAPGAEDSRPDGYPLIDPKERKEFVSQMTVPSISIISCLWEMSNEGGGDSHQVLVGTWNNMVALVDIVNGATLKVFEGHMNRVNDVVEHQQGSTCASASTDMTIKVWDLKSGVCVMTLHGHTRAVKKLMKLDDDNNALLSGSHDKTIKRWDTNTGVCVWSVQFSAGIDTFIELREGGTLIVGLNDNHLKSFRLKPRSVKIDRLMVDLIVC